MATKRNLVLEKGTTFSNTIAISNADDITLADYSARASFRPHYDSNTSFTMTASINVSAETLTIGFAANSSANVESGRYVYDAEIYTANNALVYRVVEGILTVTPDVTR